MVYIGITTTNEVKKMKQQQLIEEIKRELIRSETDRILHCFMLGLSHYDFLNDAPVMWKMYFDEYETREIFDTICFN